MVGNDVRVSKDFKEHAFLVKNSQEMVENALNSIKMFGNGIEFKGFAGGKCFWYSEPGRKL